MTKESIILKPTIKYIFSYVWLSMELFLIGWICSFIAPEQFKFTYPILILGFARIYWWFNFSPETWVQTMLIILSIPIAIFADLIGFIPLFYIFTISISMIGLFLIWTTRYTITKNEIEVKRIGRKTFIQIQPGEIKPHQHARGKHFNFGCLVIPVVVNIEPNRSIMSQLFWGQRNSDFFSQGLRIDGIPDHLVHMIRIQNLIT